MASLAFELSKLANPNPEFIDPEDDINTETAACVINKCDEDLIDSVVLQSKLRGRTAPLLGDLSEKYAGKKVSRKDLEKGEFDTDESELTDDESTSPSHYESDEEIAVKKFKDDLMDISDEEDEKSGEKDESEIYKSCEIDTDESEMCDDGDEEVEEESGDDLIQKFSSFDVNEEIEKGKAVKAQLALWDSLLDFRIKLQKILLIANRLPQAATWECFMLQASDDYKSSVKEGTEITKKLLDLLINLQTQLIEKNPEVKTGVSGEKNMSVKNKENDEEIPSDTDEDDVNDEPSKSEETIQTRKTIKRKLSLEDYQEILGKRHKNFIPYQNAVIQKWNEKTRLSSGKATHKTFSAFDQSALKQIEQILHDKTRLVKRTQLKRSVYRVLGQPEQKEEAGGGDPQPGLGQEQLPKHEDHLKDYDPEIFDDSDFYHQLLRELIERKTVDVNDPIALSRHWLEIQKLRSKMKKKVDTKASKGRKIRYDVHPKLVNFMAPIENSIMTDAAKNELYRSLFGRSQYVYP